MNDSPVSKVLVLDDSAEHANLIKQFCEENHLVAVKVGKRPLLSVLRANIDLGGILYSENYGGSAEEAGRIAAQIHAARPELPIFLRREGVPTLADIPSDLRHLYCCAYAASDLTPLRKAVGEYIFCLVYPNALVRGIADLSQTILHAQFPDLKLAMDSPYIVRDRVIFGELFSLIQLESNWCRGYMMLQTEEKPLLELILRTRAARMLPNFRGVNDLLSETTNLIWGAFKNRYIGDRKAEGARQVVQVPLIVNHLHRYISFGTENPQLCFRFTLTDPETGNALSLYERFVFNLDWSPDEFVDLPQDTSGASDAGALELF